MAKSPSPHLNESLKKNPGPDCDPITPKSTHKCLSYVADRTAVTYSAEVTRSLTSAQGECDCANTTAAPVRVRSRQIEPKTPAPSLQIMKPSQPPATTYPARRSNRSSHVARGDSQQSHIFSLLTSCHSAALVLFMSNLPPLPDHMLVDADGEIKLLFRRK